MDSHLGKRIRHRRTTLMLSAEAVAQSLTVSAETLARIEAGLFRVTPSQLQTLSHLLDVPVSYFFDAMPRELAPGFPGTPLADLAGFGGEDVRETLDLLRAFQAIGDAHDRRRVMELALQLAQSPEA